jgi:hypothetical protein
MILLAAFALVAFVKVVFAQATNSVPASAPGLPDSNAAFWVLGISAVTPLLVTGIWKLVPGIPKLVLPSITPVLGVLLGLLVNWVGKQQLEWVDMAQAGALAVFVREVFTNAITKHLAATPDVPPDAPKT